MNDIRTSALYSKQILGLIAIALMLMSSCSGGELHSNTSLGEEAERNFIAQVNADDLNTDIELELINSNEPPANSEITRFLIKNMSQQRIRFPADYSARIFVYVEEDGTWENVHNDVEYLGSGEVLESNTEPGSNWFTILSISPELGGFSPETVVRVYVAGRIGDGGNGSELLTGAYIDLARSKFDKN